MRKLLIAAGVLPLLACSAENLDALQPPAQITELSHTVTTRLHRGAIILTVHRTFRNDGSLNEELEHTLALPEGAILTSLRVGSEGALLDVEDASARWAELTGRGDAAPSVSAMLEWGYGGHLVLRLFGVAPGETVPVEYDLQLPPVYAAGGFEFLYPREESSAQWLLAAPDFELSRTPGATLEEDPDFIRVRLPHAPIDRAESRWALYRLGADRTLWRFELDAAPVLEPAPAHPSVVFVIDASHSQGAEGIHGQLELLAPYLANAPDAQVEVVLYRRFAQRLFGRFIPAADVSRMLAALDPQQLIPGNGSNLELGARVAAEALAQVSGPGRVVLFTDEQLRDSFTNDAAIAELAKAPPLTVAHLVSRRALSDDALDERRDDDHPLSPIASSTGGVFFFLTGHPQDPAEAASTMLGLVRPIRIDGFQIEAKGLPTDRLDAPEVLTEGSTLRYTAIAPRPPPEVTVTGKIWGKAWRQQVSIDPDLTVWMPGLAIGVSEVEAQLSDDEVRAAALSARAVSRVTSYLAANPTAAASTIGSESGGLYGSLFGTGGCGCGGSFSSRCGGIRMRGPSPDYAALLRELLTPGISACARAHGVEAVIGSVTLEATADEIVAVEIAAATPELAACVSEVAWAARLGAQFSTHRTYVLELGP